ncbi:MAG: DUF1236 domain-containing protein [Rhizobiales bacterium]|nr:DUF1236 domain-containing protein [Hyphomicrobiales bacterium]
MNTKVSLLALALVVASPMTSQVVLAQGASDSASAYSNEDRAFLDSFISRTNMTSTTIPGNVTVGMQMPANVQYHNIEGHPRFHGHRYAHVNNNHVIADSTGRVVAIHHHH